MFSQTVLYVNPPQIILFANFCKVSAELYRPSGLLLFLSFLFLSLVSNNAFSESEALLLRKYRLILWTFSV